jgi:hypothetical protein
MHTNRRGIVVVATLLVRGLQRGRGLAPLGDVVNDRIQILKASDFDVTRVHFDFAHCAV